MDCRAVAAIGRSCAKPGAVHPVVRAIVQGGVGVTGADMFNGMYQLQEHLRVAAGVWQQVDALLLPTTPTIYRIRELLAEPVTLNSNLGLYTNFVNLLDMSAVSVPAGFRDNGTGFGASLIGPAWSDPALLRLAARLQQRSDRAATGAGCGYADARDVAVHRAGGGRCAPVGHAAALAAELAPGAPGAQHAYGSCYRLYAMAGPAPARPALVRHAQDGCAIAVEVYELEPAAFGSFVAEVAAPLAIGSVELADGSVVKGFVAEPRALDGATDISALGGWRAHVAQQSRTSG